MSAGIKNSGKHKESVSAERESPATKERDARADKEVIEKSQEFGEGVSELVQGLEDAEVTGDISEKSSEGKKKAPAGGAKGSGTDVEAELAGKAEPPSIEIMRIQVSTLIRKEIRVLEKEAARLMRSPGNFQPFRLNAVVGKIRELKDILSGLAYATAETMKTLWMRFIKGIIP